MLQVVDTGKHSAFWNMEADSRLLAEVPGKCDPILHFYEWESLSLTYGYFCDPAKYLKMDRAAKLGLQMARRPTGGGVIFHIWDFAFSFLMPSEHPSCSRDALPNYAFVNGAVLETVQELLNDGAGFLTEKDFESFSPASANFCMARPTKYDVIMRGKKVAGAAQRRMRGGYLHQGSISLFAPQEEYLQEVLIEHNIIDAMLKHSFCLTDGADGAKCKKLRAEVKALLEKNLRKIV